MSVISETEVSSLSSAKVEPRREHLRDNGDEVTVLILGLGRNLGK